MPVPIQFNEVSAALNSILESSRGLGVLKQKKVAAAALGYCPSIYGAYLVFEHSALLALGYTALACMCVCAYMFSQSNVDVADRELITNTAVNSNTDVEATVTVTK